MNAAKVIEEIDDLPPEEQAKVIQHALTLARRRQLSADELGELADRLARAEDPAEIIRLRSAMTRGFYGGDRSMPQIRRGEGELIKTFLLPGQLPLGEEI